MMQGTKRLAAIGGVVAFWLVTSSAMAAPLDLKRGDHICLVGNGLGESLQHDSSWESRLHLRFPDHQLVVRNLCFPSDEPYLRPRSNGFGGARFSLA